MSDAALIEQIRDAAHPLTGADRDYDPLLELIGPARVVLLGEATHGAHEFYAARAAITRRLIAERGFTIVAVEADWPDAYCVNCYVRGASSAPNSVAALSGFQRFPNWMWRNTDVLEFVEWLRAANADRTTNAPCAGFYGLDLYSLYASIEAVLAYLARVDPAAERVARQRYACFNLGGGDPQAYGYAAIVGLDSCADAAVEQLLDLQQRAAEYARRDGRVAVDEHFYAEQNARLVQNAEAYYRAMFRGRVDSWNLRDQHMIGTLTALIDHLDQPEAPAKAVVWAHNSHLGDARATEMGAAGEWNVGQLARERYGSDAVLVGFTTANGTVTAASDWGEPAERKRIRPPLPGSYEALFHAVGIPRFLLPLRNGPVAEGLRQSRLERAIGVIYLPERERVSHYFHARLADQFDAVLHFDTTQAVEPLERTARWERGEGYPFAV